MKKKVVSLMLVLAFGMMTFGCGNDAKTPAAGDNQQAAAPEYKDTLTFGQGADVTSLDPHVGKETPAVAVTNHIYDTLVVLTEDGGIEPQIAESWEQIDDVTYEFKIREGIKFHDGSDLTAEDVKFSLDRAIASAAVSYIVDFIDSVEVIDEYNVRITTDAPYAPTLRNLGVPFAAIVSKNAVEADPDHFKKSPIGSGPYKFVEWKQSESVTLVANEDYYAGAPKTQNLVMKVIPEASQRTTALETNEIDIAYDIQPNDISKIQEKDGLTLFEAPPYTCYYVSMNMNKAPFDNQLVRDAINMAIDRDMIVETMVFGAGIPADNIIAPDVFGYYSPGAYEYDPEGAKALLAEAGYPDGFSTKIVVNDNQSRVEVCTVIQSMLKEIGIDCEVEIMEFGSFINHTSNGNHDMAYFGWITSTTDGDYTFYSLEHSSQQGAAGNRTFINDPEVDALVEAGRSSADEEVRLAAYKDLAIKLKEINNNAPIMYTSLTAGANDKVEGFVMDPIGYHRLQNVVVAE